MTSAVTRLPRRRSTTARSPIRDRASLAKSLEPLPAAVAKVVEVMPGALARLPDLERAAEAAWIVETVFEVVEGERRLSDADVARLVVAITDLKLRDAAWLQMQRHTARRHVALWTDVLRRTPEELVAAPACLLAFAAWLAGQGALAWCALDRCRAAEPDYGLAECVVVALDQAIPPSDWDLLGPECASARRSCLSLSLPQPFATHPAEGCLGVPVDPRLPTWVKKSRHRSSPGPIGRGTARKYAAVSTCSRECCATRPSTPTTR